jgi:tetratricopeptide (TPR) repeat protein
MEQKQNNPTRRNPRKGKRMAVNQAPTQYGESQLRQTGGYIASILNRNWFGGLFETSAQPYLARLLIGMFLCYSEGLLVKKTQAMKYMKTIDARTSQRYIRLAQEKGLLRIAPGTIDKRVDYLCPTDELLCLVKKELSDVADNLRFAILGLSVDGLPELPQPSSERTNQAPAWNWNFMIAQYTETIRLAPNNAAAYTERGNLYFFSEQYEAAVTDYTEAIRREPSGTNFLRRGWVHAKNNAFDLAVADYTKAIEIKDATRALRNPYQAYVYRSEAYLSLGNRQRAIADLRQAQRLDATAEVRFKLAELLKSNRSSTVTGPPSNAEK